MFGMSVLNITLQLLELQHMEYLFREDAAECIMAVLINISGFKSVTKFSYKTGLWGRNIWQRNETAEEE